MLIHGQTRPFAALAIGLLVAQQAAATSPASTGGARLPGANKFEPEQELRGSYSKPWLDESTVGAVDAALLDVFPAVPSKKELWEPGLLPLNCAKYHAMFPSSSPGLNFSVYNVCLACPACLGYFLFFHVLSGG